MASQIISITILHSTFYSGVDQRKHQSPASMAFVRGIVPGEFQAQRPVTRSFDVFFDLRLNKQSSEESWDGWFETPSRPLWCHCNVTCQVVNPRWRESILTVVIHNYLCTNLRVQEQWTNMTPQCQYVAWHHILDCGATMESKKIPSLAKMAKCAIDDSFSGFMCSIRA